jgi:hypothetical protein
MEERLEAIAAAQVAARRAAAETELRTFGHWAERPQAPPWCCCGCLTSTPDRGPYWIGAIYRFAGGGMDGGAVISPAGRAPLVQESFARGLVTNVEAGGVSPLGPAGQTPSRGRSVANEGGFYMTQLCRRCMAEALRAPGSPLAPPERVEELERELDLASQALESSPPERGTMTSKRRPR